MTLRQGEAVAQVIDRFTPRSVSGAVAHFARQVTAAAHPPDVNRAKAFLFCASKLGAFAETVGLELTPWALLRPAVIERCCATAAVSAASRRTLRTNLRALSRLVFEEAPVPALARSRAKAPYAPAEIAAYLALADAQPTAGRRQRAGGLVCLGAGAGLMGADLKGVRGTDVVRRFGGVVVEVTAARRPRRVPVLVRYHDRLVAAAAFAGERLVIGGTGPDRRGVTTHLTASLAGGADLARLDISRLRATWLAEVAGAIGLKAFLDAAGISCSQRLGDLVAHLPAAQDATTVALLGGRM